VLVRLDARDELVIKHNDAFTTLCLSDLYCVTAKLIEEPDHSTHRLRMTSSPAFTPGFPPWESQPVYDSPEATFPLWWTVLGSVRCSLGLS
jgi:hypothetical protein